jgi:hypothetical protein
MKGDLEKNWVAMKKISPLPAPPLKLAENWRRKTKRFDTAWQRIFQLFGQ